MSREIRVPVGDPKIGMIAVDRLLIVNVGDSVPDFTTKTLDGKEVKFSSLRGKVVLLDFWATWCAPCIAEIPNIKKAFEKYGRDGQLVVLGVSVDEDPAKVAPFVQKKDIPWPQIALGPADKNPLALHFGIEGVPATFLIGRDGKLVAKDLTGDQFVAAVAAAINGVQFSTEGTAKVVSAGTAAPAPTPEAGKRRGYIGLMVQETPRPQGGAKAAGAMVADILPDSPAARAGIRQSDIVAKFASQPIDGPVALRRAVSSHQPGDEVPIIVYRNGDRLDLTIKIAEAPTLPP